MEVWCCGVKRGETQVASGLGTGAVVQVKQWVVFTQGLAVAHDCI